MRPDVKLGIVISAVLVLVAGGYFTFRKRPEPIRIADDASTASERKNEAGQPARSVPNGPATARPLVTNATQPSASPTRREFAGRRPGTTPLRPQPGLPAAQPRPEATADARKPVDASPVDAKPAPSAGQEPPSQPLSLTGQPAKDPPFVDTVAKKEGPASMVPASGDATVPMGATREPAALLAAPGTPARPIAAPPQHTAAEPPIETHRIQPGDTFTSLAERYYGSTRYTQFLVDSNPQISDPHRLAVGAVVKIPARPAEGALNDPRATATKPDAQGPRTYRVKSGDSFYAIARDVLGDAGRWKELFELNKEAVDGDPTRLKVGQVLVLPKP